MSGDEINPVYRCSKCRNKRKAAKTIGKLQERNKNKKKTYQRLVVTTIFLCLTRHIALCSMLTVRLLITVALGFVILFHTFFFLLSFACHKFRHRMFFFSFSDIFFANARNETVESWALRRARALYGSSASTKICSSGTGFEKITFFFVPWIKQDTGTWCVLSMPFL